jgi:SPP1 gp7 family putative phage head morphogenesis protein
MMSPTGRAVVVPPVFPNAGVASWYQTQLDKLIGEMYLDARATLIPVLEATPPVIVVTTNDEAIRPNAAGVMFWTIDAAGRARVLLLHRTDGLGWAFPGGGIEYGEDAEQTARREVWEELGYRYNGPLDFDHVSPWRDILFATYRAEVKAFPVTLNDEHDEARWCTVDEAIELNLHPGVRSSLTTPGLAHDAAPTKQLQMALQRWGDKWIKKFDLMSTRLSLDFAAKNQRATETAMQSAFRKAGFTVAFKATRKSIEAYHAVAAEQVGLIRSIAQKFHADVQVQVWESVKRGGDLKTISTKLAKTYGITRRRAALIARDQNAKAKATIEAVRHMELGIQQAIWMHSHAGKEPRPTHVKMNNKLYDLAKGMWDSDEQKYVHPGELINCRCTMRPYIPGFEDARPEWDIVQT